jgi:hypothetical protein
MTNNVTQSTSPWRYLWLIALIGLPLLGWVGVLDISSAAQIDGSISTGGLIYGTARGINALVSLLQGTEFNVPFLTFSIGEVLDPVNDLIERFSNIILIALGSLALQKILLAVVSNTIFNILLTIAAAFTGLALFLGSPKLLRNLLRIFLVIAFFRFSLSLVVLANSWVDSTFLDEADQQRHLAMESFQTELRQIDTLSKKQTEAAAILIRLDADSTNLEISRGENRSRINELEAKIMTAEVRVEELSNTAGGLCEISDISPTCPDNVKNAKAKFKQLQTERSASVSKLNEIEDALDNLAERMDCLEKHRRGENCSFWDSLPEAPDPAALRQKLNDINEDLSDFAENCIDLLMSLLLKTVAVPLLFIYLLLKIMRANWARI